jgi:N-methylhydantoinase A
VPGPACYGAGGTDATVTDANLVLGRLAKTTRLGGTLVLDVDLAAKAVNRFGGAIGLSLEEAALGIIEIANSNMARAVRVMTVERGLDPRQFALLAFGGAGPMHACELAQQLGMPRAIVPLAPGVTSALGTMFVDIVHDLSQSHIALLSEVQPDEIEAIFADLESRAQYLLDSDLVHRDDQVIERSLDLRYVGQGKALNCSIGQVSSATLSTAAAEFLREYERRYQHTAEGIEIELSVIRVRARGLQPKPTIPRQTDAQFAVQASRRVVFRDHGPVEALVILRDSLGAHASLKGPVVVEQSDSTTVVPPGWSLTTDAYGDILLTKDAQEESQAESNKEV